MTHVSIQKKRKQKETKQKTKKQKTKTKQSKNKTKQNKTKQNKQTNKKKKQTKSMYFVIWPVIRTYNCRSGAYFWVKIRGDKGWFGAPRKIFDQQLAYEWYLESLNFKPI